MCPGQGGPGWELFPEQCQLWDEVVNQPPCAVTQGTGQSHPAPSPACAQGLCLLPSSGNYSFCRLGTALKLGAFLCILSLMDGVVFPAGRNK